VDLGLVLDPGRVARRPEETVPVSTQPSADVDLALEVADDVPADVVLDVVAAAAGDLLEAIVLFDVYRGEGVAPGRRSLAYRLRFCAPDRTLTNAEVGEARAACIAAAERQVGAVLR
jgi:phenylalanyl-tRNA synthetase beta chain